MKRFTRLNEAGVASELVRPNRTRVEACAVRLRGWRRRGRASAGKPGKSRGRRASVRRIRWPETRQRAVSGRFGPTGRAVLFVAQSVAQNPAIGGINPRKPTKTATIGNPVRFCCKSRKSNDAENLAKVGL